MALKKNRPVVGLIVALAVSVLAACGTSAAEPTATPQPTATATPEPVKSITVDPQRDPAGFLAEIPAAEVDCAESAVGGSDELTQLVSLSDGQVTDLSETQLKVLASCISSETVQRVVVGQLELETGGLSPESSSCVASYTAGIDFASLVSGQTIGQETVVSTLQALFCLTPDERRALESSNQDIIEVTELGGIDALECAVDGAGPNGLEQFGNIVGSDGAVDPVAVGAFMPVLIDCGVVSDDSLASSGVTTDQFSCLFEQLDPELLNSVFATTGDPSSTPDLSSAAELLSAMANCGLDLQSILDSNDASDPDAPGDVVVSSDLLLCLTDNGVSSSDASSYSAGLIPASDPLIADALAICEGDVSGDGVVIPDGNGGSTTIDPVVFETLPISAVQAQCLVDEVGMDRIEGIVDGSVSVLSVLPALGVCNITVADLITG